MNFVKNTIEAIIEHIENLDDNELIDLNREYCESTKSGDDEIYDNDEDFFNMFFEGNVIDAVRAVTYGEYRYNDKFVKFNGYANLETTDDLSDFMDFNDIANDILENPENYSGVILEDEDDDEDDE